eukprot:TRINITY_DN17271_c0_g1_i1.p1 TRINITY_DN17271_c0_g1~~TRINITY_DN17271_c0_g1_i1.p1  ORF type:complete len:134 (-),score=8.49 TRINITY_DN17271_c0_g1_i1:77-478(-)
MIIGAVIHVHYDTWLRPYIKETVRSIPDFFGQVFPALPQLNVPEDKWFIGFWEIWPFLDREMASHNVLVFDDEGHKGAAATALAYRLKNEAGSGTTYAAAYSELKAARPWADTLGDHCPQDVTWLQDIETTYR